MVKSLYELQPGDSFFLRKGARVHTVSFIDKVVDEKYKVGLELLVNRETKNIAAYDFSSAKRIYDPEKWFEEPDLYGDTHSLTQTEERELIEQIFEYKLKEITAGKQ